MSGGAFDYIQRRLDYDVIEKIENILEQQGKEKDNEELYMQREYYEKYPEEKAYYTYPKEIQEKFLEGINAIKIAAIYMERIDYLLSGDDSEEYFLERLEEELTKINK